MDRTWKKVGECGGDVQFERRHRGVRIVGMAPADASPTAPPPHGYRALSLEVLPYDDAEHRYPVRMQMSVMHSHTVDSDALADVFAARMVRMAEAARESWRLEVAADAMPCTDADEACARR